MTKMTQKLTRELVDLLWKQHDRTSCCDSNLINAFANKDGIVRCNRCLALDSIGESLNKFKIHANISMPLDHEELRQRALAKLTYQEIQALGL